MFAYSVKQLFHRPAQYLSLVVTGLIITVLLCVLNKSSIDMAERIEEVYDNTTVECALSNLTGTNTDSLSASESVIRIFTSSLERYLTDVQYKSTVTGIVYDVENDTAVDTDIVGITDISIERSLLPENGCVISWRDGFDETIFASFRLCCLVPENMAGLDEVTIYLMDSQREFYNVTLQVAGVSMGTESDALYCPWNTLKGILRGDSLSITVNALTAKLKNSRDVAALREAASYYLAEPGDIYSKFDYALNIYDNTLSATTGSLTRNRRLFSFCMTALAVLSACVVFTVSFITINKLEKTLALQRVLGIPNGRIFTELWTENTALYAVGALLGCLYGSAPTDYVVTSVAAAAVGSAVSIALILRKDLIRALKGAE